MKMTALINLHQVLKAPQLCLKNNVSKDYFSTLLFSHNFCLFTTFYMKLTLHFLLSQEERKTVLPYLKHI